MLQPGGTGLVCFARRACRIGAFHKEIALATVLGQRCSPLELGPRLIVTAKLRQQIAALSERNISQMLYEKLLCSAVTGALTRAPSPKEAAVLALMTTDEVIARLNEPKQNPSEDHEMNQRP